MSEIDRYLRDLAKRLKGFSSKERDEAVAEVRGHVLDRVEDLKAARKRRPSQVEWPPKEFDPEIWCQGPGNDTECRC